MSVRWTTFTLSPSTLAGVLEAGDMTEADSGMSTSQLLISSQSPQPGPTTAAQISAAVMRGSLERSERG